ncbi:MAG: tetratricopeptide repeat protein [Alphaproteobacteria bacterium]|nr:tetratricopeptide repeat protein [Alphaproteobacteria bacterium]
MKQMMRIMVAVLTMSLAGNLALAASSSSDSKSDSNNSSYSGSDSKDIATKQYNHAVKMIEAEDYRKASKALKKAVRYEKNNADYWNLLGFSLRKQQNYKAAKRAYDKALKIDENHLGANEYLGELYIQMGESDKAQAQLAKLQNLCPNGCEELTMLENSLK